MTPQEKEAIRQRAGNILGPVDIRLRLTDDARSAVLEGFCRELAGLLPAVHVKKQDHSDPFPSFRIAENIGYQAVPEALELAPFLDFLEGALDEAALADFPEPDLLDQVRVPANLRVFVSPHCPNCPKVVAALLTLARHCPKVLLTVVDGVLFSEPAQAANVKSAPTVVLEDRFRWVGAVDPKEIIRMIMSRDPAQLGVQSLQQMIESGDAEALARMMAERDAVFPAFIDLLLHPKWPVRLGAMVSLEFLNENRPDLAIQALEAIWDRFEASADDVKGDILYLLGESKQPEMMDRLRAVHTGDYPESVREAAGDAMEALEA